MLFCPVYCLKFDKQACWKCTHTSHLVILSSMSGLHWRTGNVFPAQPDFIIKIGSACLMRRLCLGTGAGALEGCEVILVPKVDQ